MPLFIALDLLLNVILPLCFGLLIYGANTALQLPALVINYLPDGAWAYALASSVLIIWKRKLHVAWFCVAFLMTVLFEAFQYGHQIAGTGDIYDIITYFIFFVSASALNNFFKKFLYQKPQPHA